MRDKFLSCVVLLLGAWTLAAQGGFQSGGVRYHYDRGVELYVNEKYGAAQDEFRKAAALLPVDDENYGERTRYYIAACAARQGQPQAGELLEAFAGDYPGSLYLNDVRFALGVIHEKEGDYEAARNDFSAIDTRKLPRADRDEYYYRAGYSAYCTGHNEDACNYFRRCQSDPLYLPHAAYYMAYIDYTNDDLDKAKQGFSQLADHPLYEPIIPFYLLQIEFRQGNYDYVVRNGVPLFEKAAGERHAEIARMVGESYFHRRNYAEALRYIELYERAGGEMRREELYLAGFCNHNRLYYSRAVPQLTAVASPADELGQNAAYVLADCYLQTGDKQKAAAAFSLASSADFNPAIQEDAMFNYGKLQYELGGGAFNEAITILDTYVKKYPQSLHLNEARELLLAAYFNSHNYEAAYEAVKGIRNPDNNIKTAIQKIAYFRGLEFFSRGDYAQARHYFDVADANRFTAKYTALTRFWRAETLARQGNYKSALPFYREYIALSPRSEYEHQIAHYNLGYVYFNTQQWNEAGSWFGKFLSVYDSGDELLADTYNRLGDVAFAQREYGKAIAQYDRTIAMGGASADYARYQRAVMQGLADRSDTKINDLLAIVTADRGDYVDDAMYELGRTYVQGDRFREGAEVLRNLANRYPDSPYYLSALAELGLTYQNLGNDTEALRYYKMVVEKNPNSRQAQDAMLGIRNIYVDRNEVDTYFDYAGKSGMETNVSVLERDSLSYAAAERVYQSGNYERALGLMDNYLGQYPRGAYRADALYALGDCSLREGNRVAALTAFEEVGRMPSNSYKVQALQQAARMQAEDGNHKAAAEHYRSLVVAAGRAPVITEALTGYLRESVATSDPAAMSQAASEVLVSSFVTPDLTREARFALARVAQQQERLDEALDHYRKSLSSVRTAETAESHYRIVEILYAQGKDADAEKEIFAFSKEGTSHPYWMGKAFLLLGDIYVKRNDAFQARATYQSIVDGYTDKNDGIADEARAKLDALK